MEIKIFKEAYKLLQRKKVVFDFEGSTGKFYKIKDYLFKIYLKTTSWFTNCDCEAGVMNVNRLCKHTIAGIVTEFLEQNKLELKDGNKRD